MSLGFIDQKANGSRRGRGNSNEKERNKKEKKKESTRLIAIIGS